MVGAAARRRPTMADVARAAGVSVMTVSYAYGQPDRVSPDRRDRVLTAARKLGYTGPHPGARSLRTGRNGSLGVVLGERLTYAFEDPQARRFLAGVAAVCLDHRLGLTLIPVTGETTDVDRIREAAVDAFVVWTTVEDDPVLDAIVARGTPAAIQGGPSRRGLRVVTVDDRSAACAVTEAAFRGATRPAVLSFPFDRDRRPGTLRGPDPETVPFPVTRNRLLGVRDHCQAKDQPWPRVRVAVASRNDRAEAERLAYDLLTAPDPPDAIMAMSDELALGVLTAAARCDRTVPDDLSVTGWDDTDAATEAGLTTIAQSLRDQGERCARLALGDPVSTDAPQWTLIQRTSTRSSPR